MKSDKKQTVLVFIDWFRPAYKAGGPIQSLLNIVNSLSDFNFWICTSDSDIDPDDKLENVKFDEWIEFSPNTKVIYLTCKNRTKKFYRTQFDTIKPDSIYFNSMFSKEFTLLPLLATKFQKKCKFILAPRGMLGSGPLHSKAFKKKVFIAITRYSNFFKYIHWHVSSEKESKDVKRSYGSWAKTVIAPNISSSNKIGLKISPKKEGVLELFTISRIAPIKNIHLSLQLLNSNYKGEIKFFIYGPLEDENYWGDCQTLIKELPAHIQVVYKGELNPAEVQKTINNHHFLIMPTEHENYGHSIVEALLACKPVIISKNTPWLNLEEHQVGWDIDLNNNAKFKQVIQTALDMTQEEYEKISSTSLAYGTAISKDKSVLEANSVLFSNS